MIREGALSTQADLEATTSRLAVRGDDRDLGRIQAQTTRADHRTQRKQADA